MIGTRSRLACHTKLAKPEGLDSDKARLRFQLRRGSLRFFIKANLVNFNPLKNWPRQA